MGPVRISDREERLERTYMTIFEKLIQLAKKVSSSELFEST